MQLDSSVQEILPLNLHGIKQQNLKER
uniref:Uncharacterized protein n=1 Tax=Arundo donax TaxID=35708 RepID=A0A0A8ZKR2_ARUDO